MAKARLIVLTALLQSITLGGEPSELPTIKSLYADKRGYPTAVVSNESSHVFCYSGYNATNPTFTVEAFANGKWIDATPGWCGNDLDLFEISPNSTVTLILDGLDHALTTGTMLRIRFRFLLGSKTEFDEKSKSYEVRSSDVHVPLPPER